MRTTTQETLPLEVTGPAALPALEPAEFRSPENGTTVYHVVDSPVGEILLTGDGKSLTGLHMSGAESAGADWRHDPAAFRDAEEQLRAYFAGELRTFSLSLAPRGTPFQLRVWRELTTIPYGWTTSYGALAGELGRPTASRAVGMANGRNPISIIVPCHRVIGADGSLTGYGGGLPRKRHLLGLEGAAFKA